MEHDGSAPAAARGRAAGSPAAGRGAVRPDLEQVFRAAYPRVVAVAARVLGSRHGAEDVAQEVFLAFARSAVPAGEAPGWLSVAAAHTALNHLRSGRRRTAREQAVRAGDEAVAPDVADAVVVLDERRRVRAGLARLPRRQAVALSQMLLPTDGLWRGAMNAFQDPVALAQFGGPALEGGVPFLSDAALTPAYLGWVVLWTALVLGSAGLALGRRDL